MKTSSLPRIEDPTIEESIAGQSPFPVADRGKFIKQFDGPSKHSGVVCFKFWQLVHASGCPFRCASI